VHACAHRQGLRSLTGEKLIPSRAISTITRGIPSPDDIREFPRQTQPGFRYCARGNLPGGMLSAVLQAAG
jgi:hypothetical protein